MKRPHKKTIFLITESEKDVIVFRTTLERKGYTDILVKRLSGRESKISELARDLPRLIKTALTERKSGDCIVVLHDADLQSNPFDRQNHDAIKKVCEQDYPNDVIHIIAYDEHESWVLADEGFCKAYNQKPRSHDHEKHPSETLEKLLRKHNKRWLVEKLESILIPLDGTGDKVSPSMRTAFESLHEKGCLPAPSVNNPQ